MNLGLKDKVAFVAASSQGLGRAVAWELQNEGAHVIICGRNKETLEDTKYKLERISNRKVLALHGDLTSPSDVQRFIAETLKVHSSVDILVTNTGGPPPGKFEDFDIDEWNNAFQLLLISAVSLIKGFLHGMKEKKWGRIIAITSQAVKQPVDNLILSNSVRASVVGLMKSLANELGEYNITVNNVMPGYTATERLNSLMDTNPAIEGDIQNIPLKRIGKPSEFAAAVTFLASERAGYITGASLPVDGGRIKSIL